MHKILKPINIVFYSKWDSFDKWKNILAPYNIKLFNWPDDFTKNNLYNDIEGALVWDPPKIWNHFPNLKIIQSLGAGVDHILKNPYPKNVIILKLSDIDLQNQMADYALMSVLLCQKNIFNYSLNKTKNIWKQLKPLANSDFIISILGYGTISKLVIKKLKYMGYQVKVWGRSKRKVKSLEYYHGPENLYKCIQGTSCLISILPNTIETSNLIRLKHFKLLNKQSYFINIGRGTTVNELDLIYALKNSILSASVLDVFEHEPLKSNSKLWDLDNVIITPHIAGITNPTKSAAFSLRENFDRLFFNKKISNKVNYSKGY